MASAYFAANVTKYNAGGSGDNYISSGYIKSVERIWADNYTVAFTTTKTTLDIAILPANAKLIDVQVQINSAASQTSGSLGLGFSTDASYGSLFAQTDVGHNLTVSTLKLLGPNTGLGATAAGTTPFAFSAFQKVISGTQNTLTLQFNNWTMTVSTTVKTLVRYTC